VIWLYAFCLGLLTLAGVGLYTVLWRERASQDVLWPDGKDEWHESPRIIHGIGGPDSRGLSATGQMSDDFIVRIRIS
jgi:hypothetical protein